VIVGCFALPVLRDEARGHRPHASDVLYDVVGSLVGDGSLQLLSLLEGVSERPLQPVLVSFSLLLEVVDLLRHLAEDVVALSELPLVGLLLLSPLLRQQLDLVPLCPGFFLQSSEFFF